MANSIRGVDVDVLYVAQSIGGGIIFAVSLATIWAEAKRYVLGLIHAPGIRREIKRTNALAERRLVRVTQNDASGIIQLSTADQRLASRLKDALALIYIRVFGHIVVCAGGTDTAFSSFSFSWRGMP